jgi:putative cell wall-binding protein
VAPNARFVDLYNSRALGLAVGDSVVSAGSGVEQQFVNGWAYWSAATGAFLASGAIGNSYRARGGTSGGLGFPVAAEKAEFGGGSSQRFQGGWLYWSGPTGVHQIGGAVGNRWTALGGPSSGLGYPATDDTAMGAGSGQAFTGGSLYWSGSTGVQQSSGAIGQRFVALGGPGAELGFPVAGEVAGANGGSTQAFQNGTVYWSSSGAWEVLAPFDAAYVAAGGPGGRIGYPTGAPVTYPDQEFVQPFTSGVQNWSAAAGFLARPAVTQIGGSDRYETAVAISRSGYPSTAPVVYIATGIDFPDALGAAPAAAKLGGPLLLTETNALPAVVTDEIKRLKPARIVVVGGEAVVSRNVMDTLVPLAAKVDRIAGSDRFDTARLVIRDAFPQGAAKAYVATGWDYPDALTAAAAAGAQGIPVVLVDGKAGTAGTETQDLLTKLGASTITIVGAPAVVSAGVQSSLAVSGRKVDRLGGVDRFDTALLVNAAAFPNAKAVFYATAFEFPDALAGAALAGAKKAPLYVVEVGCVPGPVLWDLDRVGATTLTLLGGTGALNANVKSLTRC